MFMALVIDAGAPTIPRRESKVERMRRYGKERNEKRKKAALGTELFFQR